MNSLIVTPVLLPLLVAAVLLGFWRHRRIQGWLGVFGMFGLVFAAMLLLASVHEQGIVVMHMGGWRAPFGIALVADLFSAIMVLLAALVGLMVSIYSLATIDNQRESFGYYPLLHFLQMGVCGAFLTGDMFNLYVCFEIMLMSSFVLLCLGSERGQIEGAIKYVTLNLISSAIFLAGVGILYGITGTLNMADLAVKLPAVEDQTLVTLLAMIFLVTFGIKAAIFPLFFWLPASYHTPRPAVSAIFAGLLTKVGVYALIRVFTLLFTHDFGTTHMIILVLAGLTMLTGVLGAAAQNNFRRILAFHIISQIGYMIMGLGLMAALSWSTSDATYAAVRLALAGSIFYIVHHIIVKTNLFLVSGVVEQLQGTGELQQLGGFYRHWPFLSILFLIPAMSLGGVPPLSGFWSKLILIKSGLELQYYWIVALALLVGLLTLYSMTKIWAEVFWADEPEGREFVSDGTPTHRIASGRVTMFLPIICLATTTVAIGLYAQPVFDIALRAADQLLDANQYVIAVDPQPVGNSSLEPLANVLEHNQAVVNERGGLR